MPLKFLRNSELFIEKFTAIIFHIQLALFEQNCIWTQKLPMYALHLVNKSGQSYNILEHIPIFVVFKFVNISKWALLFTAFFCAFGVLFTIFFVVAHFSIIIQIVAWIYKVRNQLTMSVISMRVILLVCFDLQINWWSLNECYVIDCLTLQAFLYWILVLKLNVSRETHEISKIFEMGIEIWVSLGIELVHWNLVDFDHIDGWFEISEKAHLSVHSMNAIMPTEPHPMRCSRSMHIKTTNSISMWSVC